MFCSKCGAQFPDGGQCPNCAVNSAPNGYSPNPNNSPAPAYILSLSNIISLGIALLTFIFTFIGWYSAGNSYFSIEFGPYGLGKLGEFSALMVKDASLGDITVLFTVTQILCIIGIVAFVAYVISEFLSANVLKNAPKNLPTIISMVFYCIILLALFIGLIGTFTAKGSEALSVSLGWYLTLVVAVIGAVNAFCPTFLTDFLKA